MSRSLHRHISSLLGVDAYFRSFWEELTDQSRSESLELLAEVEAVLRRRYASLPVAHKRAHEITKRFFVVVQEESFQYGRIPANWIDFVRDLDAKQKLYAESLDRLHKFLRLFGYADDARLYGGVKTDESIDRKVGVISRDSGQPHMLDLWDVVRFRIVARNLEDVRNIALRIWYYYFDSIVRCRNYYYRPKGGDSSDPYRAIHFELEVRPRRLIEVQVMTHTREILCYLDYAQQFKGSMPFSSWRQKRWLLHLSRKANIYDCRKIVAF